MTKKPLREITLDSLQVGMYITKLDIPWIESPFLSKSTKIKSTADIVALKSSGARKILIDPNKGIDLDTQTEPTVDIQPPVSELHIHQSDAPIDEIKSAQRRGMALKKSIDEAKKLRDHVKKTISDLHNNIADGSAISAAALTPLIDQTLDSLAKNNQALLNVVHLSKRSQKLADHIFSTFCLALNIAQIQGCSESDIEALGIAALLHESGWTHLPINLMGKRLPYTPAEKKLIAKHPEIGIKSLEKSTIPSLSLRIIAEHHERGDGSGYPNKLKHDEIHPLSRLLAVVDQYDAIVNQLRDRPAKIPNLCLRELYVAGQKHIYDLNCVKQLISLLGIYPISSAVVLSDKRCGIVREVRSDNHLLPVVEIIIDAKGKLIDTPYLMDLSRKFADKNSNNTVNSGQYHSSTPSEAVVCIADVLNPHTAGNSIHRYLTFDI